MENIWNNQIEKLKNTEYLCHLVFYSIIAFVIPLAIGDSQIVTGIVVNAALILSAVYMKFPGTLPIILLPSLGVFARGMIFGPFTMFLVYMIPFLWIGNCLLVAGIRYFYGIKKIHYFISLAAASILKAGFLLLSACLLISMDVVPSIFTMTMGIMQLLTALAGGIVALCVIEARKLVSKNS